MSSTVYAATPQLQCSPSSLRFGTIIAGQTETQLITLTNTGATSVTISAISADDSEFYAFGLNLPAVLTAGQTVSLNVVFTPQQNGWTGGKITFTSNASDPALSLAVAGTGVSSESLTATPAGLSFGQVQVSTTSTISVLLTNVRAWKETLSSIAAIGTGVSISGPAMPLTLDPGASVTVKVSFAPEAAGLVGGSIFISGPGLNIPLTGTGFTLGQLSVSPTALSFGSVDVGTTATQPLTMSATGGSVTISSATSSSSQFVIPASSFPLTLSAGQSVALNVLYSPATNGTTNATLTFASNASKGQNTESVSGVGIPASVGLSWAPSTSSVAGYNVYRGTTAGTYSKINSSLDPNTTYTDNTVSPGITYYYVATAVTSSGEESAYSAPPLQVAVP